MASRRLGIDRLNNRNLPIKAGVGSEYLLGIRDRDDHYIDVDKSYYLSVPVKVIWSLTVYNARYCFEIQTDTTIASIS